MNDDDDTDNEQPMFDSLEQAALVAGWSDAMLERVRAARALSAAQSAQREAEIAIAHAARRGET